MSVYTPQFAPLVVLAFLGTAFLVIVSLFVAFVAALRKARRLALVSVSMAAVVVFLYASVLAGFSLASRDVILPETAWKYFCEIDCHIAYSVESVQALRAGPEFGPSPESKVLIVELKTWFDPSTISAHRGNGPLTPNERKIRLIDQKGREFATSPKTEVVLRAHNLQSVSLHTPLRPGESYSSHFVFEVPEDARDLRLLVTSAEEVDVAIWGHESSPFHGKAYFRILDASSAAR